MNIEEQYRKCAAEYKANQDRYTTDDIDYTGCDPIIAHHLKRNKKILCYVWDDDVLWARSCAPEYICAYIKEDDCSYNYVSESKESWKHAKPVPKTRKVLAPKRTSEIIRWCEDHGYTIDPSFNYVNGLERAFLCEMCVYAGDPNYINSGYTWRQEWLEEIEVEV